MTNPPAFKSAVQCGNIMVFLLKTVQQTSLKLSAKLAQRKKFAILGNGIEIIEIKRQL